MTREDKFEVLAQNGWTVECESPLELRHEDGSFASGQAAIFILDNLSRFLDMEE